MAVVDRNVLRMAVHEMLHDPAPPPAVIIDEAIEVAKKFGSEESGAFINGILDAIRKRVEQGETGTTDSASDA
jgi:N utilization substance protein B